MLHDDASWQYSYNCKHNWGERLKRQAIGGASNGEGEGCLQKQSTPPQPQEKSPIGGSLGNVKRLARAQSVQVKMEFIKQPNGLHVQFKV